MSVWDRFKRKPEILSVETLRYAFVDAEVGVMDHKVHDIGALRYDNAQFHDSSKNGLFRFLNGVDFVCGHNIIHHDSKYLFEDRKTQWLLVDTLYLSPLLFPERPYHRLVKDDKLLNDQVNNPLNDCEKARELLWDEVSRWKTLPAEMQEVYAALLNGHAEFDGFLKIVSAHGIEKQWVPERIRSLYEGRICRHADLESLIQQWPTLPHG